MSIKDRAEQNNPKMIRTWGDDLITLKIKGFNSTTSTEEREQTLTVNVGRRIMILYTHGGNWKLCWMNLVVLIHFPLPVQVQGTCTWRILRGNNWVKRNTVSTYIGEEETDKRGQQKSQRFQHGYKSALVRSAVYYVVCIWYWWGEGKKGNLRTGQVGSSNKPRRRRKRWLFFDDYTIELDVIRADIC